MLDIRCVKHFVSSSLFLLFACIFYNTCISVAACMYLFLKFERFLWYVDCHYIALYNVLNPVFFLEASVNSFL